MTRLRFPLALLLLFAALALLPPSAAAAAGPVQTFFVVLPEATAEVSREALETCGDRFAASLVGTGAFRANQDAETQRSVSDCLGLFEHGFDATSCETGLIMTFLIELMPLDADWAKAGIVFRLDGVPSAGGNSLLLASLHWGGGFDF